MRKARERVGVQRAGHGKTERQKMMCAKKRENAKAYVVGKIF